MRQARANFTQGFLYVLTWMAILSPIAFSEEVVHRLDGRIAKVDLVLRTLLVEYEHPVSGELMEKEFFVSETAGLKHFKKLDDLKKGDKFKPVPFFF